MLDARWTPSGHAIRHIECPDPLCDTRPGSLVPVHAPRGRGVHRHAPHVGGGSIDGELSAVFNARIESALEQLRLSRRVLRAKSIAESHCLVPVRTFYEGHMTGRIESEKIGRPVHRQYLFRLPSARSFLIASVRRGGKFSIVTTRPNASVAPIHNCMPLALEPGVSSVARPGICDAIE